MNFAKFLLLAGLVFWMGVNPRVVMAAEIPFTVSGSAASDSPDQQTSSISTLKYQAVVDYLKRYLGDRYAAVESQVTEAFAEKFILDYKLGRVQGNRSLLQLVGHLDGDALKRWLRTVEAKTRGGNSLKPFLIIASSLPGLTVNPGETASKVQSTGFGQAIFSHASSAFHKFNSKLTTQSNPTLALNQPPRTDTEIKVLRDYGAPDGNNGALWVQLSPCKDCGARMETYFYNLAQNRLVLVRSDDLKISQGDFANGKKVEAAVKGPFNSLRSELDEMVSQGTLFSAAHRVVVEGIENYRTFRQVEAELTKMDHVAQALLKRSEPALAEFEVLTSLSLEDFSKQLTQLDLGGFKLKPVRSEAQTLFVRYSK